MGVIQSVERLVNNPLPDGRVDDILRPEGENPLQRTMHPRAADHALRIRG